LVSLAAASAASSGVQLTFGVHLAPYAHALTCTCCWWLLVRMLRPATDEQ
jgi:hypothetical protein